jgi:hypothetical protein
VLSLFPRQHSRICYIVISLFSTCVHTIAVSSKPKSGCPYST